jgi:molecular chaperone DnaK
VRIDEEYLAEHDGRPVHLALELSRADYEESIAPFIEETLSAIHAALESAALASSQIDEILLVGGATRTPVIHTRLFEVFGKPARGEVDPDLCVAMGAAIQGASMGGEKVSAVLVDVTPYSFGTSAIGELDGEIYPYRYVPIIPQNTPIPVRKSEAFYTVHDNQECVDVHIYQGENDDALENIEIGEFRVEGLGAAPAGNTITIDLALDRDGILHVSAKEKATGLERRISIDKAISRYDGDAIASARERINSLFGEDEEPTAGEGADSALDDSEIEALLVRARAKLDIVIAEDRSEIVDLIETINDCRTNQDDSGLADAVQQLADLLFYLET